MKKNNFRNLIIIFIIMLFVSSCANTVSVQPESAVSNTVVSSNPLAIATGESCVPYAPKGHVFYESDWTGEYPLVEDVSSDYETATFGLG